jgi:DNA polymerase-3 subunit gamma/tau
MLAELQRDGAEATQVLADLSEAVHVITRAKTLGVEAAGEGLTLEERQRAARLGGRLTVAILSRAWQMLLRGLEEAGKAPNPAAAAEMVLIRLAYTSDLPAPDEIIRALRNGTSGTAGQAPACGAARPAPERAPVSELTVEDDGEGTTLDEDADSQPVADDGWQPVRTFQDVVDAAGKRREAKLKVHLEEHVSLVKFDPAGSIELHLLAGAPKELPNELREKLNAWTGKRWMVALSKTPGERPIGEVERERIAAEKRRMQEHPAVAAVLGQFPDAEFTAVLPLPGVPKDDTGTG